jgi:hypothetical protein
MDAEKKRSVGVETSGKERKKQRISEENEKETSSVEESSVLVGAPKVG